MRVSFCGPALPTVLPPFGQRGIREFLARDLPPVDRGSMTPCMRQNLSNMEKRIAADLASRKLHPGQLVVFAADRAVGKVYRATYYTNTCPTLTTNNKYLFVLSTDVNKKDDKREFCRFLAPVERLTLQGFDPTVAHDLDKDTVIVKAAGNAYPVPLLMAILHPIIEVIAKVPKKFVNWPEHPGYTAVGHPAIKRITEFLMGAP